MTSTNARRMYKLMVALTLSAAALVALILVLSIQSARAQGEIYVDKQLGRANSTVYVGEYLTFTILIENNTTFTVTTLPLSDTFNSAVLAFADAIPSPDTVDQGTGRLDWNDLTNSFGDLAPGQSILIIVGFIAEHPQVAVVNAAEVHDAQHASGLLSSTLSTYTGGEAIGGSSPVDKELLAGLNPQVGQPLTFTIRITNSGFTTMTFAPLIDTYEPAWMTFSYAEPPPDVVDQVGGTLTWNDLTIPLGDVPPHGVLTVTTVFTALTAANNIVNQAVVSGSVDWHGNELGGGVDNVPINIIPAPSSPTATPTPRPTQRPSSTSVPAPTPTPTLVPTPTVIVPLLPQTGQKGMGVVNGVLLVVLFVLGAGMAVLMRRGRSALRKE